MSAVAAVGWETTRAQKAHSRLLKQALTHSDCLRHFGRAMHGSMTLFTRSPWPDTVGHPYLRLAVAMVMAPVALATVLTLFAFLIAGATASTRENAVVATLEAAVAFFVYLPAFTLTFGLAGVALLWSLERRGVLHWLAAGAGAGALAAAGLGLLAGGRIVPVQVVVAAALALVLFVLIRWIAGVRLS